MMHGDDGRQPSGALQRLWRCRRGAIGVAVALIMPVLIALSVGMAVETGMWFWIKRWDQTAADAGALAGVREIIACKGPNKPAGCTPSPDPAAKDQAACVVWRNGYGSYSGSTCPDYAAMQAQGVTVNTPALICPAGPTKCAAIEVVLRRSASTFSFFMPPVWIANRAAAGDRPTACSTLALSPSIDKSIFIQGSANVTVSGLCSNSGSNDAIDVGGGTNAVLTADDVWTMGNYDTNNNSNVSGVGSITTYQTSPFPDPYAGKIKYASAVPATAPVDYLTDANQNPSIEPDGTKNNVVYCPMQFTSGKVSFKPGVYIIEGQDKASNGNSLYVNGATLDVKSSGGVTFIFTSYTGSTAPTCPTYKNNLAGQISVQNATLKLAAPTASIGSGCSTDPTTDLCIPSGLLFYQDPNTVDTTCVKPQYWNQTCNTIDAGPDGSLQGASDTPATMMRFGGNSNTTCFVVVALQITYIGNETTSIKSDYTNCENLGVYTPTIHHAVLTE